MVKLGLVLISVLFIFKVSDASEKWQKGKLAQETISEVKKGIVAIDYEIIISKGSPKFLALTKHGLSSGFIVDNENHILTILSNVLGTKNETRHPQERNLKQKL